MDKEIIKATIANMQLSSYEKIVLLKQCLNGNSSALFTVHARIKHSKG